MAEKQKKLSIFGIAIISSLLLLLTVGGYLSFKSIDWTVLKRLEEQKLVFPTPTPNQIPLNPEE